MGAPNLRARLTAVAATLRVSTPADSKNTNALEKKLLHARIDDAAALTPRELSVERASWYAPQTLPAERTQHIDRLVATADTTKPAEFRVFRREAALNAPSLGLSAPAWARGGAIAETIGPLTGVDGRQFWFDFYPIARLVPVYFAGDTRPAMLFYMAQLKLKLGQTARVADVLKLIKAKQYNLGRSSIWIRADLLAGGVPAGSYVGLTISSGKLVFTPAPAAAGDKLTIPAGGECAVTLNLDAPDAAPIGKSKAGIDAAEADLTLPKQFGFLLKAGKATVTQLAASKWTLYGQKVDFTWKKAAPHYEPLLLSVLVPLTASAASLAAGTCDSPFAIVDAKAKIAQAGWALPVATIDVTQPTEAGGIGALAVQTGSGLTLGWRGLRNGPATLGAPWIALAPGLIFIVDPKAADRYGRQRLLLWQDGDSKFRSEIDLRFTDAFLLIYAAATSGSELLIAQANAEARLDRPVDVAGTPFPVRTLNSLLALGYSDAKRYALLYDDNILTDALDPNATWPVEPGRAISLAIRNALFTVTPVNSLLLFAALRDDEMVAEATLMLGMGLFGLLPTLPDPYAANVGWLRRLARSDQRYGRPGLLLVSAVAWTKAATDQAPDQVTTAFAFAPLGTQDQTIEAWSQAAKENQAQAALIADPVGTAVSQPTAAAIAGTSREFSERIWNGLFGAAEQEQFALLDVSSNADQMGVSFAWFNTVSRDENFTFYRLYQPQSAPDASSVFPLQIRELDLSAQSRFVRAFTVPQISWEGLINFGVPGQLPIAGDPPLGANFYPNDGGPTRLFNDSVELVAIAPLPVTDFLVKDFTERTHGFTGALFTLPFGLKSFAEFSRQNQFRADLPPAKVSFNQPAYPQSEVTGGLQIRVDAPKHPAESPIFKGGTLQLRNVLGPTFSPANAGTLGSSVGDIFNNDFFFSTTGQTGYKARGVPVTRIDFSGYGANIFSRWQDPNAAIAATSQAHFDVFVGRTAEEVVQVRSLVYPWGIHVVRTITMFRASSGYVFRFDSGWQAESDGIYDFRYNAYDASFNVVPHASPFEFHPGIVKGVFKVRNIRETSALPKFQTNWHKNPGEDFVDDDKGIIGPVPAGGLDLPVELQPVYFDADVEIDYVTAGAVGGRVPSKGMLGYVQLKPKGQPLSAELFAQLLASQFGAIGGPVECVIDVGKSHQLMRLSRVDVNVSSDGAKPIFVSAARGAVVLPKDGAWSVVQHNQGNGEVSPVDPQAAVPLIRRGKLIDPSKKATDASAADLLRLANPLDLVRNDNNTRNFGLLQSTGTQKALFRLPSFQDGMAQLFSLAPDFADAYRILNSAGIFPNVQDALPLNLGTFQVQIVEQGYRLVDPGNLANAFKQPLPNQALYLVNEDFLKVYVEYAPGGTPGELNFGFDATAAAKNWLSKVNDIAMVVDLGPLKRLMTVRGKFNAEKGAAPAFGEPELEFSDQLKPVIDLLQILLKLQGGDYAGAFQSGLDIAMSNSADSWNYAFHARKEIPLVRFPPTDDLYYSATTPLKLECHLAVGVYFNEVLQITDDPKQLIPSIGAFLGFGGRLSVMCVSLAAATVYATGSVDLTTSGDVKTGPALDMKFGFGAEIVVSLPVVGNVSLLFMVGVEIDLDSTQITISGFLLFRGRAELLEGIVTIQIQIEAKGSVQRKGEHDPTNMIAQVTFAIDVSIFLIINLHFSQSWEETRQIA